MRCDSQQAILGARYGLPRQALALDSSAYRAYLLLGFIQAHRKQAAEALMHCQRTMSLNPNDADGAAHRTISLANPVVYLVSGFRWSFFGTADVRIEISLAITFVFLAVCLAIVAWIFRTGYG
jgi:hypothetical protein